MWSLNQIKQKRRKALQLFKKLCVIPTQKHEHFLAKNNKNSSKWKPNCGSALFHSLIPTFPKFLLQSIERALPSFHWISRHIHLKHRFQSIPLYNGGYSLLFCFLLFVFLFFAFCFLLFSINSCLMWCMIKAGENIMAWHVYGMQHLAPFITYVVRNHKMITYTSCVWT